MPYLRHRSAVFAPASLFEDRDDLLFSETRFLQGETPDEPFARRFSSYQRGTFTGRRQVANLDQRFLCGRWPESVRLMSPLAEQTDEHENDPNK